MVIQDPTNACENNPELYEINPEIYQATVDFITEYVAQKYYQNNTVTTEPNEEIAQAISHIMGNVEEFDKLFNIFPEYIKLYLLAYRADLFQINDDADTMAEILLSIVKHPLLQTQVFPLLHSIYFKLGDYYSNKKDNLLSLDYFEKSFTTLLEKKKEDFAEACVLILKIASTYINFILEKRDSPLDEFENYCASTSKKIRALMELIPDEKYKIEFSDKENAPAPVAAQVSIKDIWSTENFSSVLDK